MVGNLKKYKMENKTPLTASEWLQIIKAHNTADYGVSDYCEAYAQYRMEFVGKDVEEAKCREFAHQLVEENFKGLNDLINDEDITYFYKGVIEECIIEGATFGYQLQRSDGVEWEKLKEESYYKHQWVNKATQDMIIDFIKDSIK
jgi:hypothetical protein